MIKKFLLIGGLSVLMSTSCMLSQEYQLTGKPIGTKVGVAKSSWLLSGEFGVKDAAKNGGITKIGAVEITVKHFAIVFNRCTTKVYGE